mgnify:CR=1 FL=1
MRKAWALLISAIWLTTAHAQQPDKAIERPLIVYKIQAGDTLSQLSQKYLRQPADLTAIRDLNHLRSIDLLPSGEYLKVPREAVKQESSHATIISISCARTIHAGQPLKPIYIGAVLEEGVVIDIPAECHVSMRLEDSSIIRLPSSAAIKISVLRKNAMESSPEVQLDLVHGRVELEVYKGRSKTTPFEVRTPLSITGVRGTEFRVGYSPTDQVGQVEVIGGVVNTMGVNDTQSQAVTQGQGVPFDKSGKAMPVEKLLNAPVFERAELINRTQSSYAIKLTGNAQANHYVVLSAKSANLLGEQTSQTLSAPEIEASNLSQVATFYQVASVSNSGLMGTPQQYGFCTVPGEIKSGRCRAVFEAPLADGAMITFSLIKHASETAQEMVSTKQLQARNGRFMIEGLPAGRYTWSMSYNTTKQSGYFDLIAFTTAAP